MNTTESMNSASSRAGVLVFSVAHKRVSHDHEHEHEHDHHTTSRLQPTRQRVGSLPRSHPGLWGTPVGPGRTPTVHRCPKGKAVGGPHETTSDRRQNDTDKRQDKRAFSETGVDCNGPGVDTHLESYTNVSSVFPFFLWCSRDLARDFFGLLRRSCGRQVLPEIFSFSETCISSGSKTPMISRILLWILAMKLRSCCVYRGFSSRLAAYCRIVSFSCGSTFCCLVFLQPVNTKNNLFQAFPARPHETTMHDLPSRRGIRRQLQ